MMSQSIMKGIIIYQKNLTPSAKKVQTKQYAHWSSTHPSLLGYWWNAAKIPLGTLSWIWSPSQHYPTHPRTATRCLISRREEDFIAEIVKLMKWARRGMSNVQGLASQPFFTLIPVVSKIHNYRVFKWWILWQDTMVLNGDRLYVLLDLLKLRVKQYNEKYGLSLFQHFYSPSTHSLSLFLPHLWLN